MTPPVATSDPLFMAYTTWRPGVRCHLWYTAVLLMLVMWNVFKKRSSEP